jgi:uncharacterized membrane protein
VRVKRLSAAQDARRFGLLSLGILVGTAVLLVAWGTRAGWQALAPLPVAALAVWISPFTIFGSAIENVPYSAWELSLIAWVLDLLASVALLAGLPLLARLPVTGATIARLRERAFNALDRYPGLERMAFAGVGLFVFLPIPGSGSVIGTLVGQIIGLSRTGTLIVVAIGTGLALCSWALLAELLGERWETWIESPLTLVGGLLVLGLFAWFAWVRVRRELQRA